MNTQALETVFNTEYAEIQLHPDFLLVVWKKYADDPDFRECVLKQIEILEQHNIYKVIVDANKFRGTSIESRQFFNEEFNALAERRGKDVYKALIFGEDVTGRFSLNKIVAEAVANGKGEYFGLGNTTIEEAKAWVLAQN